MPSNEVIKQIRVLDAETEVYSDYELSADAEGIEVELDGTTTDLQSAITGLDTELKNKGQATWNGEGKDAIINQSDVYNEHVKFGQGTGTATVVGTVCNATMSGYVRKNNGIVMLTFSNDVPANATLNIQETGAKPIYFANTPILNNIIHASDTATFVYDANAALGNGAYRLLSVDTGVGNTLLNPDPRDLNYEGNTGNMTLETPVFEGTSSDWENLSSEEKEHYDGGLIHLNDENEYVISDISDEVELNNMDAVTSNAVAKKFNEVAAEIAEDVETSNIAEKTHNVGEYIQYQNEDNVSKFAKVDTEIEIGDSINEKVTDTSIGKILGSLNTQIVDLVYPVGSIYMSVNSVSPSTLFAGTTWEVWGSGKVPVGVDENDFAFNTVGKTGGEKTHTLTVDEMPSHNHAFTGTPNQLTGDNNKGHKHSVTVNLRHRHAFDDNAKASDSTAGGHRHTFSGIGVLNARGIATLELQSDGNIVMYQNGAAKWQLGTAGTLSDTYKSMRIGRASDTITSSYQTGETAHYHWLEGYTDYQLGNGTACTVGDPSQTHQHKYTATGTISEKGSGNAHNNLQPYITCYMWKRTS